MRIILYTGKGGVGKTSVAASTALRSAELGYKTIVFSTDAAHSLGDAFNMPLSEEPVSVVDNLWAQEIDVLKELDVHWDTVRNWLTALMRWQGVDEVVADELTLLPGATRQHLKSANKEMLLALRSMIDGAIAAMEREPKPRRGRTRIEVE